VQPLATSVGVFLRPLHLVACLDVFPDFSPYSSSLKASFSSIAVSLIVP